MDLESQYLPVVIASENDAAPYEALKAQAVASRSFALYKKLVEPRSKNFDVCDSEADQVYSPKKFTDLPSPNQEDIKRAVKETKDTVLKYDGKVVAAFFVSGKNIPRDETYKFVTYNEGKTGDSISRAQKPIGDPGNPSNHGVMGQVQAKELAYKSYDWQEILKYFYGSDIGIGK
ncbi:MAG: Phage protein [Dehalococcoidia bacterium]|nr:Phage protein [Dehalococcoidia bacterium]